MATAREARRWWSLLIAGLALTCVVGAVLAFGGLLDLGSADDGPTPDADETAEAFFDAAIAGDCSTLAGLTWYPVDIDKRRSQSAATCRSSADSILDVDLGEPRRTTTAKAPVGVSDYVELPARVELEGGRQRRVVVRLVQVDGRWYVTG